MAASDYLSRALAGLSDMAKGLTAALAGAKVAADDEDVDMDVRSKLREAVKATEYARQKTAEAAVAVASAQMSREARSAS